MVDGEAACEGRRRSPPGDLDQQVGEVEVPVEGELLAPALRVGLVDRRQLCQDLAERVCWRKRPRLEKGLEEEGRFRFYRVRCTCDATCVEEGAAEVLEISGNHEENVEQDRGIARMEWHIGKAQQRVAEGLWLPVLGDSTIAIAQHHSQFGDETVAEDGRNEGIVLVEDVERIVAHVLGKPLRPHLSLRRASDRRQLVQIAVSLIYNPLARSRRRKTTTFSSTWSDCSIRSINSRI